MSLQSVPPKWPTTFPDTNPQLNDALKDVLRWMWQELSKAYNQPGLLPLTFIDLAANQGNYPAGNYQEGSLFFSSDTHHLWVVSSATWVQVV